MATEQLLQRIHALEAEALELRSQLAAEREKEQQEYVQEILDYCQESEWDVTDIAKLLLPKKSGSSRSRSPGKPKPITTIWVDPKHSDRIYKGRGVPMWMREDMIERGMDPSSRDQRQQYRDNNLVEQAVA